MQEISSLIGDMLSGQGAVDWGVVAFSLLQPHMHRRAIARIQALCPGIESVVVAAFPYYGGDPEGNLSVSARGLDYHIALLTRLGRVCTQLKERFPHHSFVPQTDASPVPESIAARKAGVGIRGDHGLVICPPYGSYVFLGTILTSFPLTSTGPESPECDHCGRCVRACPWGALKIENGRTVFDSSRCLSYLTQKKGTLTSTEAAQVAVHPYIWGCDLCQHACLRYAPLALTPLPELWAGAKEAPYLANLGPEELSGLDEAAFQRKYKQRSFAWRGLAVLCRNLELQSR